MANFRADTFKTIRQFVGLSLGVMQLHTTDTSVDNASVIAATLRGGTNDHLGKWVRISDTSATTANETSRQVTLFDGVSDLTTDAFGETIATSIDFELWDEDMDPDTIETFINRAINSAYKRGPRKSEYLGVTTKEQRYTIPSGFVGLSKIERRVAVESVQLVNEGKVFDKTVDSDFTSTKDLEDHRWGNASSKFVIAVGAAAGDTASVAPDVDPADITGMTHLEFWIKAIIAGTHAASDWAIQLKEGSASLVDTIEVASALTNRTWELVRIALDNPEDDDAINEVAVEMNTDVGASTLWIDALRAIRIESERYQGINKRLWSVNTEDNQFEFETGERSQYHPGNTVIRITGVAEPRALSADTDVTQVDPTYLIPRTMEYAYMHMADRRGDRNPVLRPRGDGGH